MKLMLLKNGETETEKVERINVKSTESHGGCAVMLHLESGDLAVLKLEDSLEVARLIEELEG